MSVLSYMNTTVAGWNPSATLELTVKANRSLITGTCPWQRVTQQTQGKKTKHANVLLGDVAPVVWATHCLNITFYNSTCCTDIHVYWGCFDAVSFKSWVFNCWSTNNRASILITVWKNIFVLFFFFCLPVIPHVIIWSITGLFCSFSSMTCRNCTECISPANNYPRYSCCWLVYTCHCPTCYNGPSLICRQNVVISILSLCAARCKPCVC